MKSISLRELHHGFGRGKLKLKARWPRGQPVTRGLHASAARPVVKPFLLADIGEGIREVQIIQWFVQPGARVEQFDKLCEVQSDKASVEITSRFDGVIKKLHYEADDMAEVGKALLDIDIQSDISPEDEALITPPATQAGDGSSAQQPQKAVEEAVEKQGKDLHNHRETSTRSTAASSRTSSNIATPAVRHLAKELHVDISNIAGTGRDGRVLKEDIQKFVASKKSAPADHVLDDEPITLTPIQHQMFKTMTRSLTIPHFLYTDAIDMTALSNLRATLNSSASSPDQRISALAFILKALSIAFTEWPILNARLDTSNSDRPQILIRGSHNFGIAVDTPQGLVVPVIKTVQNLSIADIATNIKRLTLLARESKLTASDLTGGTFTVSNVGSIGGSVVGPVIVESQVAILGIGKVRTVPAFGADGSTVKREECIFSWSADHRVVDGATVARVGEHVRRLLEQPATMMANMR